MKPPKRIDLSEVVVREVRDESDDYESVWYVMAFDDYYYEDPRDEDYVDYDMLYGSDS